MARKFLSVSSLSLEIAVAASTASCVPPLAACKTLALAALGTRAQNSRRGVVSALVRAIHAAALAPSDEPGSGM